MRPDPSPTAPLAMPDPPGDDLSGPEGELTELGECRPGFPAFKDTGRPCAWIGDDLCYDTREMACNCACPRDHDSQCISSFDDGPNGRVQVVCE